MQVTEEMLEYPLFSTVFTMGHKASRQELINNTQLAGCSTCTMLPSQDFRAKKERCFSRLPPVEHLLPPALPSQGAKGAALVGCLC